MLTTTVAARGGTERLYFAHTWVPCAKLVFQGHSGFYRVARAHLLREKHTVLHGELASVSIPAVMPMDGYK